jgi:hypothetical protein
LYEFDPLISHLTPPDYVLDISVSDRMMIEYTNIGSRKGKTRGSVCDEYRIGPSSVLLDDAV